MERIYTAIKILAFFGIFLAVYLLWERYYHPTFQPCNVSSIVNCNAIISGEVSNTLGIPTPFIGLVGYTLIFVGTILKKKKFVMGMVTFGLLFCLYIGFREVVQLHVICPVCILCQLDMVAVWVLSFLLLRRK